MTTAIEHLGIDPGNAAASPPKLYLPSNGTEGHCFFESWCCYCARDKAMREGADFDDCDDDEKCDIIANSFIGPVPEWIYGDDGVPKCTAYVEADSPIPVVDTHTLPLF
jgi:hypothetical protein